MGNRGPQRKSAEHLRINGSRIDDGRGIALPASTPTKPDWIAAKPIASRMWDETIAELSEVPGLLSTLDRDAMALYADVWQQFHDAQKLMAEQGMVCISEKGGAYLHPSVGIANKARDQLIKLGSMFGLNPPAREGMIVTGDTEDDEFARLLR